MLPPFPVFSLAGLQVENNPLALNPSYILEIIFCKNKSKNKKKKNKSKGVYLQLCEKRVIKCQLECNCISHSKWWYHELKQS